MQGLLGGDATILAYGGCTILQVTVFGCLKKSLAWKILEVPVYDFQACREQNVGKIKSAIR
jgi:hypothetical protein